MGEAIGGVLGFAVGVAISPVPIIAVILMLFSARAAGNGLSFLLGWVGGLALISAVVLAIGLESGDEDSGGGIVKVVIGVLFLFLALKQWRGRPAEGEEPAMPAWMAKIDEFTPIKALGLALLLSSVNPKNLGLTIAAASTIGGVGLAVAQEVVAVGLYVILASLTIIVPVVSYLVAREAMTPALDSMKGWLTAHNATVMAILFLVLGAKVLGDGIVLLSS
ncbi:GAP family protein [Ornithinimicrobium sp. F0845]|uniref:GAP family protein n=1 Tax=Ornithinimicrobium sp. F0845 TaxID=2926412 RepID=UPI001FF66130|nr:GAP family protein [Ornithinimicrobium sp. F0845]MCK0113576.1 GAP family protein [Ornithinimicrobium sp. F0845]